MYSRRDYKFLGLNSISLRSITQTAWTACLLFCLVAAAGRTLVAQTTSADPYSPFSLPQSSANTQQDSQTPQISQPPNFPSLSGSDQGADQSTDQSVYQYQMDQDGTSSYSYDRNCPNQSDTRSTTSTYCLPDRNQDRYGTSAQDPRAQDPRVQDPRAQDSRALDSRAQDPRAQYPRAQYPNIPDPRLQDPNQLRRSTRQTQPLPLSEFQKIAATSVRRILPIFGANLFNDSPSTFAPIDNIPVTPDYVIGPGDELQLQVWGQINQRGHYVVDRTGSIQLPEVGTVHVAGVEFSLLAAFLKTQLGRVYRNFDLNVNLGQLRSIQVFVVGRARQPGSYTIGSLSTLLNGLLASGGPLPTGSLRDIEVRRNGETVTHFDLYDLLLHGDKSKDIRLASGDVIFIPAAGPQVAVAGSVNTPGIYELLYEKSFAQVMALAGGITSAAFTSHVRVDRIDQHTERSFLELDLAVAAAPSVQNGDIIIVNSVVPRFKDTVILRGNVENVGRYAWHAGMRISDLIPNRDALVTRNYYDRKNALAQSTSDYSGPLQEGSIIQAGQRTDIIPGRNTSSATSGSSAASALISSSNKFGARTDVILTAPDIDWYYAVIQRQSAATLTTSLLPFNLGKVVLDGDSSQNLALLPGDVVTIFTKADIRVPNAQQTKFVKLEGEFAQAGVYSLLPGETLTQLVQRAGGITPDADLFASEFSRESVRRLQRQRLDEYADNLEAEMVAHTSATLSASLTDRDAAAAAASNQQERLALNRLRQAQPSGRIVLKFKPDSTSVSEIADLALEDGDRFVLPKVPSHVSVQGQVYNSNAFLYENGRRVQDYLHLAGGPNRTADKKSEYILRADGSVLSSQYSTSRQHGNFNSLHVLPGDTIVVPPKLERGAFLRNLLNISTILQGFGIGATAIQVLR